jgi:hypothetical protein
MPSPDSLVGGCLCGTARFAAQPPILFCCHCHCHWCRRAHGAAFVTWVGVRDVSFRLMTGETLRWYRSSEQSERGFCNQCGTTMFFRSTLAPGEMHIALACVDDAAEIEPKAHVFYDTHVNWVTLGDELPRYDRNHEGLRKYQAVAVRPGA